MTFRMSPHLFGLLVTIAGVLALSPDALLIRLVAADSASVLFWRGIFFSITIFGFYSLRFGAGGVVARLRVLGRRGLLAALFYSLSSTFFVLAITHTSIANALVIIATAPLFAAVFSWIFLKEAIRLPTWIAIFVCLGGIGLIFAGSLESGSYFGDFCALMTASMISGQFTTVRHAKDLDMVPSLGISGLLMAAFALPFAAPLSLTGESFAWLALLGFVVLPIAIGLITIGPRYISAPEVSLLLLLESFFGPLWAWMALGEVPTRETVLGGAIVISTLILHTVLTLRQGRRTADAASGIGESG
ncbi:DMT family transporter [Sneathiella sp.]|uniref:DMT family transporter n=1 Tax=Sneathiella sp. TaxID=1964365 RepID=UPI002FE2DA4F